MRLEGTLEELNCELSLLTLVQRSETQRGSVVAPIEVGKTGKRVVFSRQKYSRAGTASTSQPVASTDIDLNFHLSLLNIAPLQAVQSRTFPRYYHPATKKIYDQLVYIQWVMPEIADTQFNIDDLLPLAQAKDRFYAEHYFLINKEDKTAETEALVYRDVKQRVRLYSYICHRRRKFRNIFTSYNLENMQLVRDILSMNFATYLRFLKDLLLLNNTFDVIEAVKVFYQSAVHSKQLPDFTAGNEKKWLTDLLRSFNFESNYRLKLPGFIESLVRIAAVHPRFRRINSLSLCERFVLLYKKVIKPNVRLVLGLHYKKLLSDVHVIDTMAVFETDLQEIFQAYHLQLPERSLLLDFKSRHHRLPLSNTYSLFGDQHLLRPGEIIGRGGDSLEQDIETIKDDEIDTFHVKKPTVKGTLRQILARNRGNKKFYRPNEIRFPSSSTANVDYYSERIRSRENFHSAQANFQLLPFSRPLRNELLLDRFELFSFFLSALEVSFTQGGEELFLSSISEVTDDDFVLDFSEFVNLVGLIGIHYWKTVAENRDLSLVEGLFTFLKQFVTRF